MGYRFTVGMQGAGVPGSQYQYADFVEVPFQVWDVDNNKQLQVSFRDQQENGVWDLIGQETGSGGPSDSREYMFIHNLEYSTEIDPNIATNGGQEYEDMYFMWPYLAGGAEFDAENLPEITLKIVKTQVRKLSSAYANVSDAYFQFGGINNFSNSNFVNQEGVHPDQHGLLMIPENDDAQTFRFLATNDGGIYITNEGDDPGTTDGDFNYAGFGYNTSQFYGADKAPGEDRYIGGMQDNSTFFTPVGVDADSSTRYDFAIGGDGFESIWNNRDGNMLIGGSQFNNFARSLDNGASWQNATSGFSDNGPFVTRLANSKNLPDKLYTVGGTGVWYSNDFGGQWNSSPITSQWSFNNSADVEVSHADINVIWAGGFLGENARIQVSQDGGLSFTPVSNYDGSDLGFVSGIGTHATDPGTGYLLFSFSGLPKVIKTTDYGVTWEDISGFEGNNGVSDRGFPDVATNCLLVFPNDVNRIWVGSEIGIIESLDGGASWSLLDANMPPANVHEFKIQDDQVVIATYGRGIWSVDVPEVEQETVFNPLISSAAQSPTGALNVEYLFGSTFDSTMLKIDDSEVAFYEATELGTLSDILEDLMITGDVTLQLTSFKEGEEYDSPPFKLSLFDISDVATSYENDFSDPERADEFTGFGFRVILEDLFDNEAIHSDHFYPNQVEYTYTLTRPYTLSEGSSNLFRYDEVVLIEPGEPGTVFGDDQFWDYGVVEATKDGITWTPIADGYDSRADSDWLQAYNSDIEGQNSNALGSAELYKTTTTSLLERFEIGDTLLFRFRLFTNQAAFGWGWAIDNIEIGDLESTTDEVVFTNVAQIFPNPTANVVNVELKQTFDNVRVQIFDVDGKLMLTERHNTLSNHQIDLSRFNAGTYIIRLQGEDLNEVHRVMKL